MAVLGRHTARQKTAARIARECNVSMSESIAKLNCGSMFAFMGKAF